MTERFKTFCPIPITLNIIEACSKMDVTVIRNPLNVMPFNDEIIIHYKTPKQLYLASKIIGMNTQEFYARFKENNKESIIDKQVKVINQLREQIEEDIKLNKVFKSVVVVMDNDKKPVADYRILQNMYPHKLEVNVEKYLYMGYKLVGDIGFNTRDNYFIQAVIKN